MKLDVTGIVVEESVQVAASESGQCPFVIRELFNHTGADTMHSLRTFVLNSELTDLQDLIEAI